MDNDVVVLDDIVDVASIDNIDNIDDIDDIDDMDNVDTIEIIKITCREAVLGLFPDICPDYLEKIAVENEFDHEKLITIILDQSEKGQSYPKRQRTNLKRKRSDLEEDDTIERFNKRFDNPDRRQQPKAVGYVSTSKALLMHAFPHTMVKDITRVLDANQCCLFPAYLELDESIYGENSQGWRRKKIGQRPNPLWKDEQLDETIKSCLDIDTKSALEEFQAVRLVVEARTAKREAEKQREEQELENINKARAEGTMTECECCCDEFPLNRMVHCRGEVLHWFCRGCAKRMAENQIGLSKYHLACMSMSGCDAGFSTEQQRLFLDANSMTALERIEQEAVLRLAGIENLETCPFCPYAAEYPPIQDDKEFRCKRPDCEIVSCRLCRKQTHIPKSCEEACREVGHSARRVIEEAMSAALIRNCNKCGTPFIKENGCNKMMCTRNGCMNVQCYVCHKSCDYSHFDDAARGGKKGNCPLFDSVEKRHEDEVRLAEEQAREQVRLENPGVDAELFEIKVSEKVKEDEERRKKIKEKGIVPPPPPRRIVQPPARALGPDILIAQRRLNNLQQMRVALGNIAAQHPLRGDIDGNLPPQPLQPNVDLAGAAAPRVVKFPDNPAAKNAAPVLNNPFLNNPFRRRQGAAQGLAEDLIDNHQRLVDNRQNLVDHHSRHLRDLSVKAFTDSQKAAHAAKKAHIAATAGATPPNPARPCPGDTGNAGAPPQLGFPPPSNTLNEKLLERLNRIMPGRGLGLQDPNIGILPAPLVHLPIVAGRNNANASAQSVNQGDAHRRNSNQGHQGQENGVAEVSPRHRDKPLPLLVSRRNSDHQEGVQYMGERRIWRSGSIREDQGGSQKESANNHHRATGAVRAAPPVFGRSSLENAQRPAMYPYPPGVPAARPVAQVGGNANQDNVNRGAGNRGLGGFGDG